MSFFIDPAFDAIPNQQKQGLMKTLLSYVGIKAQDTSLDSYTAPVNTQYATEYSQSPSGMTSHYMAPSRDLQNRKAA